MKWFDSRSCRNMAVEKEKRKKRKKKKEKQRLLKLWSPSCENSRMRTRVSLCLGKGAGL